jgi:iron complex transport system substrate-binding protein
LKKGEIVPMLFRLSFLRIVLYAGLFGAATAHATQITDQRDHQITLQTPAQRVVYIPPAVRNYLSVADTDKQLVGSSAFALRMIRSGLLGKLFPGAAAVPDVTSNGWFAPNVEAVLATHPDAVFQTVQIGSTAYEPLEQAGLNVIGITGTHGEADFLTWARLAGAVSGKEQRADQLIRRFESRGAALARELGTLTTSQKPRVLYLMSVDPIRPMVGDTAFDQAIQRAGGINVAGKLHQFGPVSFEQILLWNPQVILISGWPEEKHVPEDLVHSPEWSTLAAVKAHRVYKVPLGGQRFAGLVEGPLFWQWLAELLHPRRVAPQLRALFRETYQTDYGYDLSDKEIDHAIYFSANKNAEGYQRFAATRSR